MYDKNSRQDRDRNPYDDRRRYEEEYNRDRDRERDRNPHYNDRRYGDRDQKRNRDVRNNYSTEEKEIERIFDDFRRHKFDKKDVVDFLVYFAKKECTSTSVLLSNEQKSNFKNSKSSDQFMQQLSKLRLNEINQDNFKEILYTFLKYDFSSGKTLFKKLSTEKVLDKRILTTYLIFPMTHFDTIEVSLINSFCEQSKFSQDVIFEEVLGCFLKGIKNKNKNVEQYCRDIPKSFEQVLLEFKHNDNTINNDLFIKLLKKVATDIPQNNHSHRECCIELIKIISRRGIERVNNKSSVLAEALDILNKNKAFNLSVQILEDSLEFLTDPSERSMGDLFKHYLNACLQKKQPLSSTVKTVFKNTLLCEKINAENKTVIIQQYITLCMQSNDLTALEYGYKLLCEQKYIEKEHFEVYCKQLQEQTLTEEITNKMIEALQIFCQYKPDKITDLAQPVENIIQLFINGNNKQKMSAALTTVWEIIFNVNLKISLEVFVAYITYLKNSVHLETLKEREKIIDYGLKHFPNSEQLLPFKNETSTKVQKKEVTQQNSHQEKKTKKKGRNNPSKKMETDLEKARNEEKKLKKTIEKMQNKKTEIEKEINRATKTLQKIKEQKAEIDEEVETAEAKKKAIEKDVQVILKKAENMLKPAQERLSQAQDIQKSAVAAVLKFEDLLETGQQAEAKRKIDEEAAQKARSEKTKIDQEIKEAEMRRVSSEKIEEELWHRRESYQTYFQSADDILKEIEIRRQAGEEAVQKALNQKTLILHDIKAAEAKKKLVELSVEHSETKKRAEEEAVQKASDQRTLIFQGIKTAEDRKKLVELSVKNLETKRRAEEEAVQKAINEKIKINQEIEAARLEKTAVEESMEQAKTKRKIDEEAVQKATSELKIIETTKTETENLLVQARANLNATLLLQQNMNQQYNQTLRQNISQTQHIPQTQTQVLSQQKVPIQQQPPIQHQALYSQEKIRDQQKTHTPTNLKKTPEQSQEQSPKVQYRDKAQERPKTLPPGKGGKMPRYSTGFWPLDNSKPASTPLSPAEEKSFENIEDTDYQEDIDYPMSPLDFYNKW